MRRSSSVCHHSVRTSRSSLEQRAPARVADARVVEPVQQRGDVPLVVEHRAARGLGRVRGQDVLDLQLRGQRRDVDLVALEDLGRLGQRLALHGAGGVVLASPAHALALLGDVRQLQLERAGADDRLHRLVRARRRGRRRAARRRRCRPHARRPRCGRAIAGGRRTRGPPVPRGPRSGCSREARCLGRGRPPPWPARGWERRDASWRGMDGLEGRPPTRNPIWPSPRGTGRARTRSPRRCRRCPIRPPWRPSAGSPRRAVAAASPRRHGSGRRGRDRARR